MEEIFLDLRAPGFLERKAYMWPVGTRDARGVFLVQPTANAISSDEKKKKNHGMT